MKDIEQTIRKNLEAFNQEEPGAGHFDRFDEKLDQFHSLHTENWFERNDLVLRIAASALVFLVIGGLLFTGTFSNLKFFVSEKIMAADLPPELKEVMQYYNVIADTQVNQIDALAVSEEEAARVKSMAMLELKDLEENQSELEKEFRKNPGNERIMHALVMNQQKKTEILDKIIHIMNQLN
ncbi:MAG: hypothetical protein ACNA7V_12485 [Bacteroidales bacterium]